MTVIHGTVTGPGGGRPQGAAVVIALVDLEGQPVIGFAGSVEVVGVATPTVAADGTWTATLTATASITSPRGDTLYRVDETSATGRARYYISVPASGTPWVGDLRVTLPGGAEEQLVGYLPLAGGTMTGPLTLSGAPTQDLHAATKAYVDAGGGGGGTPSDTVIGETSYGQAADEGAATTYSRGDHTHGTPALPTPGAIGAAAASHTHAGADIASGTVAVARLPVGTSSSTVAAGDHAHTGVYDPAGTAASAVATHEADTTNVHGIADTSALETTTGSAAKVSTHAGASDPHGDRAYTDTQVATKPSLTSSAATTSAVGDAAAAGSATTAAKADHTHGREAFGAVTAQTSYGASSANGSASTLARSDHTHGTPALTTPAAIGALQAASNLSDLASAATARANLSVYCPDLPSLHGYKEWNWPPDMAGSGAGTAMVGGTIYGLRVDIQAGQQISNIIVAVGTAGSGLTSGQCIASVIDGTTGTELARTGDISSLLTSSGIATLPLTSSFTPSAGAKLAVMLLVNGTTPPQLVRSSSTGVTVPNAGLTGASPRRFFTAGTGQTSMPSSFTMGSTTATGAITFWVAFS